MLCLSSLSPSSISQSKFDVFLSFRGDTRKNFTDHLYAALKRRGIVVFRDEEKLEAGEAIKPELLKAIQESWCSIIVFSEMYAFSSWCLDELVEIIEQSRRREHKVFPIFYNVDPSNLRNQSGKVAEAFIKHEQRYKQDKEKTQMWRSALTEVTNIKGWHLNNRHEADLIADIVGTISVNLYETYPSVPNELIGIGSRLEELYSKIEIREDDIRFIGICGMGGIGKTTLARVVYSLLSSGFEAKSFLSDVRQISEKCGLVSLQKQLLSQLLSEEDLNFFDVYDGKALISRRLSHKKVLVVIDDVDNAQHLKCLVGNRDWFGFGSRIIITSRDEHLLRSYGMDDVFKPKKLYHDEALRLFCLKAFKGDTIPENDFIEFSEEVVKYADGLPLAVEVLGSFLHGRDAVQWRSTIERLKRDFNKDIDDRLRISFDGLEEIEKNIFLDIACFFKGDKKDFVMMILNGCGFFPDIGIDVLIKKSLVTINHENKLMMHDLLQEMGRKIVQQKSTDEPGKRCRLWEERDVYHVLTGNTATEAVEGITINNKWEPNKMLTLRVDAFSKMKNLRLLRVLNSPKLHDLQYLSNELRLLEWLGYPLRSLPSCFQPDNLVALVMPHSCIQQLWKGSTRLENLRWVDLKSSQNLIATPDLSMAPNLESLILEGCSKIVNAHPSIALMRKLKLLNLRGCRSLRSLPTRIKMESLEILILSGCSNLKTFPEIDGVMKYLLELHLDGSGIKELPSSIGHLSNLVLLNLKHCRNLVSIPSSVQGLKCLQTLDLSGCSKDEMSEVQCLDGWKVSLLLKIMRTTSMDSSLRLPPLSGLTSLRKLNLSDCKLDDGAIPSDISYLSSLKELDLSGNNFISLPANLNQLNNLDHLNLSCCMELKSLPKLPESMILLEIDGCPSLEAVPSPTKISRIIGINCNELVKNNNVVTLLKKELMAFPITKAIFNIVIPGSKIPEWFEHQSNGVSVKIALPHGIQIDRQWVGIAFSYIFSCPSNDDDWWVYNVTLKHGEISQVVQSGSFYFGKVLCRRSAVAEDHLWVRYWHRDPLFRFVKTMNSCADKECRGLEIEFSLNATFYNSVKVKRCGVRLVYQKDLEVL